jgi:hypothetical protein
VGDPQKAANYYRGRGSTQTIRWVYLGFQGKVTIQATLDNDPADSRWFEVAATGDGSTDDSTTITATYIEAVMGNFTWLRAAVTNFKDGTIQVVQATY